MDFPLLFIGLLFITFSYFIGVKQKIELVTFIRNKTVTKRKRVAFLLGTSQLVIGILCVLCAIFIPEQATRLVAFSVVLLVGSSWLVAKRYAQ